MENPGISILREGHCTRLKWHRGRRQRDDIPFTAARIVEGLRLGASVEVDINCHRDHGFVVLHNKTLEIETNGTGVVRETAPEALRQLKLRRADGSVSEEPVLLLGDLISVLASETLPDSALLQLDLKENAEAITAEVIARFGHDANRLARHIIISGGDFDAVTRLASAAPGIGIGFDPCFGARMERLDRTGDFASFIESGLADGAGASTIYLEYRIVIEAAKAGVDMVAAVHGAGKLVDAWTLNPTAPDASSALRALLDLKVDQITTDEPVVLQSLLGDIR